MTQAPNELDRSTRTRAERFPPLHASARTIVVGLATYEPLSTLLAETLPGTLRFVQDVDETIDDTAGTLAISFYPFNDAARQFKFAVWAQRTGKPAITVMVGRNETSIGPLALPGRPTCAHCARIRMIAAAAAFRGLAVIDYAPTRGDDVAAIDVSQILASEIYGLFGEGIGASPLLDHVVMIDRIARETSLHRVIPLAWCPVCGGAARLSERSLPSPKRSVLSTDRSADDLLVMLDGWVGARTGLIPGLLVETERERGVKLPVVVTAAPPHIIDSHGGLRRLPIGWGKGVTISEAVLSAVGEAIERYAASVPDPARITWARPRDIEGDFLDPRSMSLYAATQYARHDFQYAVFDPDVRHPWVLGRLLGSETPLWVPAIFVFLNLALRAEQAICQGSSNGLAAAQTFEVAALHASLELVERDAFLAAWLTGCTGQRVLINDSLDPPLRAVLEQMEALGASVELYTLPTSVCGTTALCLGLGDGNLWPGVTMGLGADLDPRIAVRKAILELGQTGPYLRRMMQRGWLLVPEKPEDVRDMLQHAAFFFSPEHARMFDRVRNSAAINLDELCDVTRQISLADLTEALEAANIRIALIDVTSPDVATGPFRVARAVSPDLQPLWYGWGLERQIVRRIRALGLAPELPLIHPIW